MKLSELITTLVEMQVIHGDLDVKHHDCEWGISDASPSVTKVIKEKNGDSSYEIHVSDEHAVNLQQRAEESAKVTPEAIEQTWEEVPLDDRKYWGSKEEFVKNQVKYHQHTLDSHKQYIEAPYVVIF